jgi:transcriptional regulator with XRE-family HTH domain
MAGRRARRVKAQLAANVVRLRRERGLSQVDLAAHAHVQQKLISSIELARANPTLESLYRIAQALDVRVPDLFNDVQK